MCDNVSPKKSFRVNISDIKEWFGLDPFCKVVCCYNQESLISWSLRKGPYYIQSPLSEWPWAGQGIQLSSWLIDHRSKPLTFVTFPNVFQGIGLHVWPPVSLRYSSMRQGSPSSMTFADPFMYFKVEVLYHLRMYK